MENVEDFQLHLQNIEFRRLLGFTKLMVPKNAGKEHKENVLNKKAD